MNAIKTTNGNGGDARLLALEKREADIRAKLAAARELKRKREALFRKHLAEIIGGALIGGELPPELKSAIVQFLASADLDTRQRRLLQESGSAA